MPRQLPWKAGASARPITPNRDGPSAGTTTPVASSARRTTQGAGLKSGSHALKRDRSPSTSPPPAPPVESFMIEGLENDDAWRMVEDEFFSVAGSFTAHLHAAEYQRLKKQARSQNEETIRHISRPVTGEMTDLVRRRHLALDQASRQREGLKRALASMKAEDDDDDEPWVGTSLQGLMDSPRKKAIPLTSVTSTVLGTKAAAGFVRGSPTKNRGLGGTRTIPPHNAVPRQLVTAQVVPGLDDETDDDDDEDLEGPPLKRTSHHVSAIYISKSKTPIEGSRSTPKRPSYDHLKHPPLKSRATMDDSDEDPDAGMVVRRSGDRKSHR
ncbi:hypothetical protein NKR23_g6775 [Pleurostoma richardsiae]|uniref:Uncharacterized protein n=1 Tax=Pleurostoma richardsiae TaxID=41990 RepID=A0AA38RV68_9PEZI|nr:hypothetical protein NKR23_g6775 [Pleurostoma richardsiae]